MRMSSHSPRDRWTNLPTLLWVVTACITLSLLLGTLSRRGWIFDLCTHFRIHAVFALVCLGIIAPIMRRWRLLAAVVTVLVITLATIATTAGSQSKDANTTATTIGKPLRIVHFNVLVGNPRNEDIARYIADSNADLVFLMEVNENCLNALRTHCDGYIIAAAQPRDHPFGFALLSRSQSTSGWTLNQTTIIQGLGAAPGNDLDRAATPPAIEAVMQREDKTITVLGLHPPPPVNNRWWKINLAQLRAAADWANNQTTPTLIIGDLNATPWSIGFRDLVSCANLIDARDGRGLATTWPANWPAFMGFPIDHSLHSRELRTIDRQIHQGLGSDHRAVETTIDLVSIP